MDKEKDSQQKINQLQLIQQNLQNILMQRQQLQMQLNEMDSALEELEKTEQAYKIIGNIMVASKKEKLKEELKERKEMFELKIKNFEKQEKSLKEKAEKIQQEVMKGLQNDRQGKKD